MSKQLIAIQGFEELTAKLKQLPDRVKRAELLKIYGQVANPTVLAARALAPKSDKPHHQGGKRTKKLIQPGNLKRSIGKIIGKRGLGKENAVLYVGPRSKGRKDDGWYGAMVHDGTVKQAAQPFMKKAYDQTAGLVSADAEQKVTNYLQKQIDRLSR